MSAYLVDTSVIIDYLRGKETAVELLDNIEGDLLSSYICMAEIYEGVNRVDNRKEIENAVINFFASLSDIYGVDENIAKKFGEISASLKKKGILIEDLDIFLAATALVNGLTFITFNQKHFLRVPDLKLYPV